MLAGEIRVSYIRMKYPIRILRFSEAYQEKRNNECRRLKCQSLVAIPSSAQSPQPTCRKHIKSLPATSCQSQPTRSMPVFYSREDNRPPPSKKKPSTGPSLPSAHQCGNRSSPALEPSSSTACVQCRWSFFAWPSRSSCLSSRRQQLTLFSTGQGGCYVSRVFDGTGEERTLANLSGRVCAVRAGVLLDVERAGTCCGRPSIPAMDARPFRFCASLPDGDWRLLTATSANGVRLVVALAEAGCSLRCDRRQCLICRCMKVCVAAVRNVLILAD